MLSLRGVRRHTSLGCVSLAVVAVVSVGSVGLVSGCAVVLGFEDTRVETQGDASTTGGKGGGHDSAAPGDEDDDGGVRGLAVNPKQLIVTRGGAPAEVLVELTRGASDAPDERDVQVSVAELAPGVTSEPAVIKAGAKTATLKVSATKSAALGTTNARVVADDETFPPAALTVIVSESPGSVDTGFGKGGVAADAQSPKTSTFHALAVTKTDAILAGGVVGTNGWLLRRFSDVGTMDAAFAPALPASGAVRGVAVDSAGRIVCVGTAAPLPAQLAVVRLDASGAVDKTFGGGLVRLALADAPLGSTALAVAIGSDDSVWVSGVRTESGGKEAGVLVHYTPTGALDPAFNGGRPVVVQDRRFVGVAADASGGSFAAGTAVTGNAPSFFLMHRTSAGAADPAFGTAGSLTFGAGFSASAFATTSEGGFALAGAGAPTTRYAAGLASAEGVASWARAVVAGDAVGYFGLAAQGDGRLVLAGHSSTATGEARVDRLMPDGTRDATFGGGAGVLLRPNGANPFDEELFAVAVQASGRLLIAGNRSDLGATIHGLWP